MWILYFFNRERERREGKGPPGHTLKYDQFKTPVRESLVVTMTKRLATATAVTSLFPCIMESCHKTNAGTTSLLERPTLSMLTDHGSIVL